LAGTYSTSNLTSGTINSDTGGVVNLGGTLDNTSSIITHPTSGIYTLGGATITGGTVDNTSTAALTFGNLGGTLNGVSMTGNFTVPSSATFKTENGAAFSAGTTTFAGNYVYLIGSSGTALTIGSTGAWTGNVQVQAQVANLGFVNNGSLTNSSGNNYIYGGTYSGFTFTNSGSVSATGGYLTIGNAGNDLVTNNSGGTITASGGGAITLGYNGGDTITNSLGATLEATGAGSSLTLGNGTTT
jgi:hypothetical protein